MLKLKAGIIFVTKNFFNFLKLKVPNKETLEALEESKKYKKLKKYKSHKELLKELSIKV